MSEVAHPHKQGSHKRTGRDELLDLLDRSEEPESNSDVALRCQQYHAEVQRWDTVRETYFAPVVDEACAIVNDAVTANRKAKFFQEVAAIAREEHSEGSGTVAAARELAAELSPTSLGREATDAPVNAWNVWTDSLVTADELPSTFPRRSVTGDAGSGEHGLPPRRTKQGQCATWQDLLDNPTTLPSSYHPLVLQQATMRHLVNIEMDFRRPEAERALEDLKSAIIVREVLKMQKKKTSGKGMTLRNQSAIGKANEEVRRAANAYRRHWVSLRALGMPQEDPHLRRLVDADLEHFDVSLERDLGKSTRVASWLWENFSFVDAEQDPRYQAFYEDGMYAVRCASGAHADHPLARKVHWFRSSAQHARWQEELEILLEEMRRTIRFFVFWERWWLERAERKELAGERGEAAYNRRQETPPPTPHAY